MPDVASDTLMLAEATEALSESNCSDPEDATKSALEDEAEAKRRGRLQLLHQLHTRPCSSDDVCARAVVFMTCATAPMRKLFDA